MGTKLTHCKIALPYPAPCIGLHRLTCDKCGQTALVTAAGRKDDPRSITLICRGRKL